VNPAIHAWLCSIRSPILQADLTPQFAPSCPFFMYYIAYDLSLCYLMCCYDYVRSRALKTGLFHLFVVAQHLRFNLQHNLSSSHAKHVKPEPDSDHLHTLHQPSCLVSSSYFTLWRWQFLGRGTLLYPFCSNKADALQEEDNYYILTVPTRLTSVCIFTVIMPSPGPSILILKSQIDTVRVK
jgi:hypothetical protein